MPYAVVERELKTLNETYLQKVFDYIVYLQAMQNSKTKKSLSERQEAIAVFKSFAGTLPKDFDVEKERDSYFVEKYGVA